MNKTVISLPLMILLILSTTLAACNQDIPVCPDTKLEAPILGAPQTGTVTNNLTPVLSWHYPNPNCRAESYRVSVSTVANHSQVWTGTVSGVSNNWSPATPLLPGRMYEWTVSSLISPNHFVQSLNHLFFTGPLCDAASLHAPSPSLPINGSVLDNLHPTLLWDYPDPCLPDSTRIDFSTDLSFSELALSLTTGDPSSIWYTGAGLADCTTYYWRLAPMLGGALGPFSAPYSFSTDREGLCSPAPASLQGLLWYDQCSLPMDSGPVALLPPGCVMTSNGVDADALHQPSEPFMSGIVVDLGAGSCPSPVTQSTLTGHDGAYNFIGLTGGEYCLSVDAAGFLAKGETGHWTLVTGGHQGLTSRSIHLLEGQFLTGQDFAWYRFTGPTPTPTSAPHFDFTPAMNLNCHTGPDLVFPALDVLLKGTPYPVDGRNLDGTWLRIMLDANKGCWVMTDAGTPSLDPLGARVLLSPPTPTPTPEIDCSDYKDEKSCEALPVCQWKASTLGTVATFSCTAK